MLYDATGGAELYDPMGKPVKFNANGRAYLYDAEGAPLIFDAQGYAYMLDATGDAYIYDLKGRSREYIYVLKTTTENPYLGIHNDDNQEPSISYIPYYNLNDTETVSSIKVTTTSKQTTQFTSIIYDGFNSDWTPHTPLLLAGIIFILCIHALLRNFINVKQICESKLIDAINKIRFFAGN
jgi:hypothetical protein